LGYYSVRRKPRSQALDIIAPIYAEMLAVEREAGAKGAIEASGQLLQQKLDATGKSYEHFVLEI